MLKVADARIHAHAAVAVDTVDVLADAETSRTQNNIIRGTNWHAQYSERCRHSSRGPCSRPADPHYSREK